MERFRWRLLRLLAGKMMVVLNTDIHFYGAGCHIEPHAGPQGPTVAEMYVDNLHFYPLK